MAIQKNITPARLAFYSSLVFWGTSIPVLVATIFILRDLVSRDDDIIISSLLGFIVSCFTLPWFLRRNTTRYQIQIISQQGEPRVLSGGTFVGFIFGVFWRSIVVGVVTGAIAALLRGAYGSEINAGLSLKIDLLESFLCSFLSFWWVYAAPMGKYRIVFGVGNTEKNSEVMNVKTNVSGIQKIGRDNIVSIFTTIIAFVSIPVMLLNFGGSIIGGIWLAVLGKWGLIGLGILSIFFTSFGLGWALMPGMLLSLPGAHALERRKYVIGVPCVLAGNLWTVVVMTVWCVGCFYVVFDSYYSGGSVWPYLLWTYGMATGPWTYMAAQSGSDDIGSGLFAFGACLGTITIMGLVIFGGNPSKADATVAFCIPMAVVLILQTLLAIEVMGKVQKKHA